MLLGATFIGKTDQISVILYFMIYCIVARAATISWLINKLIKKNNHQLL